MPEDYRHRKVRVGNGIFILSVILPFIQLHLNIIQFHFVNYDVTLRLSMAMALGILSHHVVIIIRKRFR